MKKLYIIINILNIIFTASATQHWPHGLYIQFNFNGEQSQ